MLVPKAARLLGGLMAAVAVLGMAVTAHAQDKKPKSAPTEDDYYRLLPFPLPEDVVLEVGGLDFLDASAVVVGVPPPRPGAPGPPVS